MTVSCGDQNFKVMIQQAAPVHVEKVFTATHLGGVYYSRFILDNGTVTGCNYYVILSDMQPYMVTYPPVGATEYRFDLYSDVCGEFNNPQRVPIGVYNIDHRSTGNPGTIDGDKDASYLYDDSKGNAVVKGYSSATVTVTEDGIVADVVMTTGEVHRVENTIERICHAYGAVHVEVFSIISFISATVRMPDGSFSSQMRRIRSTSTNLTLIERYNALSRRICSINLHI